MTIPRIMNLFAGMMISISFLLAHMDGTIDLTTPSWLWLGVFVGLNLFQFAITGFCPLDIILRKAGFKDTAENHGCGGGGCGTH
ncbi:MAG: DUF2892 domain-containing protein [Proteobacteria bacterium]|nr:DUF2892 domain-containing protein [Pseudomonadota bacterium]